VNEWMNEWMNEQMNEQSDEKTTHFKEESSCTLISERKMTNKWMDAWRINEQKMDDEMNKLTGSMNERINV